jgi:sulfite reductase beta subunit-like hemoprotein
LLQAPQPTGEQIVGLSSVGACGDIPRTIMGNPLAGIDKHELFDTREIVEEIYQFFQRNYDFSNLPRKYKMSISANVNNAAHDRINCLAFTPAVKEIDGENPIKANGKMIVIDGGFSKAYQSTTGIAGYTLLYNSFGMQLVAHKHFNSKEDVLINGTDVLSVKRLVDKELERKKVLETNVGEEILQEVSILNSLMEYRYMN